jgi:hypothetical protein
METKTTTEQNVIAEAFETFLCTTSADRLIHLLRAMLVEYLTNRHENLPEHFNESLEDLNSLFDLLDVIHKQDK